MDAVTTGLGSDVKDRIAFTARRALDDVVTMREAEAEDVDQRIAGVLVVEVDLAADGRNADAVPVATDAGDNACENAARQRSFERPEAKGIEEPDGPGAHGEDVANDAADARRRPLIGFDERRMVVGFDLEHRAQSIADVHGASVFPGALHDARAGRRQRLEVDT